MPNLIRSLILLGLLAATVCQAHEFTECDRLVAHPLDPDRITTGVPTSDVKHPEGIAACLSAVADDPDNARLNYQLARVYYYDDQVDKAMPYLEMAAAAGYRGAGTICPWHYPLHDPHPRCSSQPLPHRGSLA